jgi:hypothetical protein
MQAAAVGLIWARFPRKLMKKRRQKRVRYLVGGAYSIGFYLRW